jgi:hypothetical protein
MFLGGGKSNESVEAFHTGSETSFADPWDSRTPLIIVAAHFSEDLDWLKKSPFPVVVCSKHGAEDPAIPADPKCTQANHGREASAYLKFIVEYYHELPERIAFIHGHETAWHQGLDMREAIRRARTDLDYVGLNGTFYDDRDALNPVYTEFKPIWDAYFKPYVHRELPERILHDCCAQFVVSRRAISRIPWEAYRLWLDVLLDAEDDYTMGTCFEYVWHVIFGQSDVYEHVYDHDTYAFSAGVADVSPDVAVARSPDVAVARSPGRSPGILRQVNFGTLGALEEGRVGGEGREGR